ncbi:MAG: hypothetical protein C5B54_11355 [Acidobacteria bacterium]|nr:MAG: hypothetical protein C5B54_11355 [Acidobacteriota bacterium]
MQTVDGSMVDDGTGPNFRTTSDTDLPQDGTVIYPLKGRAHYEIKEKIDYWHSRLVSQLYRFNTYADMWRLVKPPRSGTLDGFANPQVTETTRATEAIATFLHRALTSAQPNFQLLSHHPQVSEESLWKSEIVLSWQQQVTGYAKKLLKALRSCTLMGTVAIEEPFISNRPYYEATDFIPRSLLQIAFDPLAIDMTTSGWHATIDFVTEDMLKNLAQKMPQVWGPKAIQNTVDSAKQYGNMTPEVIARLAAAGYYSFTGGPVTANVSHVFYLVTYYGPLNDNPLPEGQEWVVSVVNDLHVVRAHPSSYRRRPFVFAHLNEFELEPYGYGVGRVAESLQPEINSNRGRMHDTITFSLFNMWIASRMANIKTSQLKIKPWGVVETDDAEGLKPIRPQLEGVNFGIQLENLMKQEFRATTGATDNLQALVTEATATESSIAQTEAVRRLSVMAEIIAEPLLREHLSKCLENNTIFLDQPFWVANTGNPNGPVRIFPSEMAKEAQVIVKVVNDKDFRPQRNKDLLQFIQVVSSIRSQITPQTIGLLMPFIQEFARGVQVDPNSVVRSLLAANPGPGGAPTPGQAPGGAVDQAATGMQIAEAMRSQAGALGQASAQRAGANFEGAAA